MLELALSLIVSSALQTPSQRLGPGSLLYSLSVSRTSAKLQAAQHIPLLPQSWAWADPAAALPGLTGSECSLRIEVWRYTVSSRFVQDMFPPIFKYRRFMCILDIV